MRIIGTNERVIDPRFESHDEFDYPAQPVHSLPFDHAWAAIAIGAYAYCFFGLMGVYPLVLPGGAVISWGPSVVGTLVLVGLSFVSAALESTLFGRVPTHLGVFAAASVPLAFRLATLLWGMPATLVPLALALAAGLCGWVVGSRRKSRVPTALCCAMLAGTFGLLALVPIGNAMYRSHPRLFSMGYATRNNTEGCGVAGGLAARVYATANDALDGDGCNAVIVSPYSTDIEGRFVSWGDGPEGEGVLLVASEYIGGCAVDAIDESVRNLIRNNADATLYTGWLDGRLWIAMHETMGRGAQLCPAGADALTAPSLMKTVGIQSVL